MRGYRKSDRIERLTIRNEDLLAKEIESYKRDFCVVSIVYPKDSDFTAYIEYNYRPYPYMDYMLLRELEVPSIFLRKLLSYDSMMTLGELRHYFITGEIVLIHYIGSKILKDIAIFLEKYYGDEDFQGLIPDIIKNKLDYTRTIEKIIKSNSTKRGEYNSDLFGRFKKSYK